MSSEAELPEHRGEGGPQVLRERRQRLKSQLMSEPTRLDLREQLASVYRAERNTAQAGRWNYLSASVDPSEAAAFEVLPWCSA